MSPDKLEEKSDTSKRHQRSRSLNMTCPVEVIDLATSVNAEISTSRKHDRIDKDSQFQGPNKRPKYTRDSEPPMRKDKSMIPRVKRKKLEKEINHCKASRTSNHQKLKESVATLEHDLSDALAWHHDAKQQLKNTKKELKESTEALEYKLMSARQSYDDVNQDLEETRQALEEVKEVKHDLHNVVENLEHQLMSTRQTHQVTKQELEHTKQELKESTDAFKYKLTTARQANNKMNEDLKKIKQDLEEAKEELKDAVETLEHHLMSSRQAHQVTKQELEHTKNGLKDTKEALASKTTELEDLRKTCDAKSEEVRMQHAAIESGRMEIQSFKALVDNPTNGLRALQKSCRRAAEDLKAKNAAIAAKQEELDISKHQTASLKETLDEAHTALNTAKSNHTQCLDQLVKREEKLISTERDLDEANKALEEAQREADALLLVNAKHGHQLHSAVLGEEKAKSELKSERKEHRNKVSGFQAERAELQTRCADLQATIQRHNYKEPDEKIKKDFASLESSIRQFVDKFARPVLNATEQELGAVWPNWSPKLREFLASPLLCNRVFEAYVWEYLVARIFKPGSEVWAGDLGRSLEKTLCMAADEIAEAGFKSDLYIDLQYLRSTSSSLISRVNGADFRPKYFDSDVKTMISTLGKLTGPLEDTEAMQADAMRIFKGARDFEIQLRKLKATHTLRMHKSASNGERLMKYGFNIADEDMDDRSRRGKSPEQAQLVDFIMCPGLYKRGSNSGTNYETTACLIKMGVVCNATELYLNPGPSTSARSSSTQAQGSLRSGKIRQGNEGNVPGPTAKRARKGSSVSNPVHVNLEETDVPQQPNTSSAPSPTFGPLAPKSHDAAQMQSSTTASVKTRSQASPKTENKVQDAKSKSKSTNNHFPPMRAAKGRGGGSSGKRTRTGKFPHPDGDFHPASGTGLD